MYLYIREYMFIVVSPVSKWKKSLAPQNPGDREGRAMLLNLFISCALLFSRCWENNYK